MAKYYYDRYRVNSSTTYTWSRYSTKNEYSLGPWQEQESLGTELSSYSGYASYSVGDWGFGLDVSGTGGSKTIYSRTGAGRSDVVYENIDGYSIYRYFFSTSLTNDHLYREKANGQHRYVRGDFQTTVSGQSYSYKQHNQRNSDGYWWVRGSASTSYSRGSFIDTIIAEDGTYPDNGRVGTTYWYIKRNKAFPDFKVKADGQLRTAEEGWVKVNGILRPIEQMWVKDNGTLKEV